MKIFCCLLPFVSAFTEVCLTKASVYSSGLPSPTTFKMVASVPQPGSRLKKRLGEAGAPPSEIQIRGDINPGKNVEMEVTEDETTVQVKTIIWEVSCNYQNKDTSSEEERVEKFYVVTAKKMSDKVDLSLLRDLVYKQQDLPFGCTPSRLSMAPTKIAEDMTGFESGCMPPIGHNVPMKLFLDESILEYPVASIGSGTMGHSLLLPMSELIKVAKANGQGLIAGLFIRTRSQSSASVLETDDQEDLSQKSKDRRPDRRPEPKDRLREYRSFSSMDSKATLLRTTARKKGRVEMMTELVEEAIRTGDFPHLLQVSEHEGRDKNALHLSAWRGDFEVVKLLVDTARIHCPELDVVNVFSRGRGNYGKTPIFYALTQCREDVVRYLVSQGASLVLVNNKGQTPCSIAVSHMEEECCEFLYETELHQLKAGEKFSNFRKSHSDEKLYGDLDPRFEIDAFNMDNDLASQTEEYKKSTKDKETLHGGYPMSFSPRSLRPTVRWWKREDRSLATANSRDLSGQITFTQPRIQGCTRKPEKEQQRSIRRKPSPEKILRKLDLESFDILTIDQVLDSSIRKNSSNDASTVLVNCTETIRILESEVDSMIIYAKNLANSEKTTADEILVECIWGLDCEWLPGKVRGKDNPVSTLQLSAQNRSFLIDLQCLCQAEHLEASENISTPTDIEMQLCEVLQKVFSSRNLSIVGFGILQDLGKLAASFPHLSCFTFYSSVIELQSVSNIAVSKAERQNMSSLKRMVGVLLERRLDKTQQCSDWTRRPLLREQLDYATLDAAVLPLLLKKLMETTTIERYNGQFFATHSDPRSRIRFTLLQEDNPSNIKLKSGEKVAWHVPMGRITETFSRKIARQSWPGSQTTPDVPKLVPVNSSSTKKETAHPRKVGASGKKAKPIELKRLLANLDNLPIPGTTLGYTKDSCAHRVVGHEFMNTLPDGTHVGFNRRSGVVETTNAWIIFCNFGGSQNHHTGKTTGSGFLREGRDLLFNLNPKNFHGKSSEKTLYEFVSSPDSTAESDKKILLFARDGTRYKYTYCGICECDKFFVRDDGKVELLLNLMDYNELMHEHRISTGFLELVEKQNTFAASIMQT